VDAHRQILGRNTLDEWLLAVVLVVGQGAGTEILPNDLHARAAKDLSPGQTQLFVLGEYESANVVRSLERRLARFETYLPGGALALAKRREGQDKAEHYGRRCIDA
jgi:hypothetical protein